MTAAPPARLPTRHGDLALPAFLPDATYAVVRAVDAADLVRAGVRALMVNALHVAEKPGLTVIEAAGGLHRFMGWTGPIVTDSGGFQALSLGKGGRATVTDDGIIYATAHGKRDLTPESSIERQLRLKSDVVICLDECPPRNAGGEALRQAVRRTIRWAIRGKAAFARGIEGLDGPKPKLFAVVQGGDDPALRRECARALTAEGFDGYGFGGWPVDARGRLLDAVALTAGLLPPDAPKLALGLGGPEALVQAHAAGWRLFDCTLPTRDARHGRLYVFRDPRGLADGFCERLDLTQEGFARDQEPLERGCDCATCATTSRAYLHHLFAIGEIAAARLATVHNLRFWSRLTDRLSA